MPEFLCIDLNPQTEFSRQTKSFRKPIERISGFTDLLLQPVARKQASYIKDAIDFVPFIENTPLPDHAIFATLDVYLPGRRDQSRQFANATTNTIRLTQQSPHPHLRTL